MQCSDGSSCTLLQAPQVRSAGTSLFNRFLHPQCIQSPHFAPEFLPIGIKEDECGGKTETVYRSQFLPHIFLNIQADNV